MGGCCTLWRREELTNVTVTRVTHFRVCDTLESARALFHVKCMFIMSIQTVNELFCCRENYANVACNEWAKKALSHWSGQWPLCIFTQVSRLIRKSGNIFRSNFLSQWPDASWEWVGDGNMIFVSLTIENPKIFSTACTMHTHSRSCVCNIIGTEVLIFWVCLNLQSAH